MTRRRRWAWGAGLAALLLAIGLVWAPGSSVAANPAAPTPPPAAVAPPQPANTPLANQGAYQLGKVRILGVPVITVAAPVINSEGDGPDATTRARVIEGNLEMLYRGRNLCSGGEALAEALVHRFLVQGDSLDACGLANASLLGPPEALTVRAVRGEDGLHRLEARVAGRPQPLPLLTVTPEDAKLNGLDNGALAARWQRILQGHLRLARQLLRPEALLHRWVRVGMAEGVTLLLVVLILALWQGSRKLAGRLDERFGVEGLGWRQNLALQGIHGLSLGLLMVLSALLLTVVGLAVLAVPGQVPTALDLLLQPWGIAVKLVVVWVVAVAAQSVLGLWLKQWVSQVSVPLAWRHRRRQRYRSLKRVLRRLVHLSCLLLAALWILAEMPGVRELSDFVVLAGGAFLGGLVIVFQGLFRDVLSGLKILFADHFAMGDSVEIRGLRGEVSDLGLLSTELRCLDQRTATFPNSVCLEVINHTKFRSGAVVELTLSHRCGDLRQALAVIRAELEAFAQDPAWRPRLPQPPELRGVTAESPWGISVEVLLVTEAAAQGAAGRELRLRLLERLRERAIPLAEAPDAAA
ncbi:MAG: mechanosensitive ion channel domain-containing protein [Cyanobacteriota bacterium]|nr:mechanosensitive ion channel domain-containing protein [Cyanobacteriota bacterium]